jgi:uncharacterized OB-fold protein
MSESVLTVVECKNCGKVLAPPKYMCSECAGGILKNIEIRGEGTVYSFTRIVVPPVGFEEEAPYDVALIELPELILTARILPSDEKEIDIGSPVRFSKKDRDILWFELT